MRMRHLVCALLGLALAGCADTGPSAPVEGRLGLDTNHFDVAAAATNRATVGRPEKVGEWLSVYAEATNRRPHATLSESVKKAWSVSVGNGVSADGVVQVPPIVTGDTVYTVDTHLVVQATRLRDGKRLWRKELPVSERTTVKSVGLTMDDDRLYVAAGDGHVWALDKQGTVVWEQQTNLSLRSGPVAVGHLLFVSSLNNDVVAMNQKDGKTVWSVPGQAATTTFLGMATPAVARHTIIMPTTTGLVNAYTTDGGVMTWTETMWAPRTFSPIQDLPHVVASPVIDDRIVYLVGNAGKTGAYHVTDGRVVWTKPIGGRTTPAISGKTLFLVDNQNHLKALDTRTGNQYWDKNLSGTDTIWQGPVIAGSNLVVTSSAGDIVWFDAVSGQEVRRENIEPIGTPPVMVQDKMLVLTIDGYLHLYQ